MLRIASHNLCDKVLISSLCRVPRITEDAKLRDFRPMLWVVALRLTHCGHLTYQFARLRVPPTVDNQLFITRLTGLIPDYQTTFVVFGPCYLKIRATPAQRRIAPLLLLLDQALSLL